MHFEFSYVLKIYSIDVQIMSLQIVYGILRARAYFSLETHLNAGKDAARFRVIFVVTVNRPLLTNTLEQ